MLKEDLNARVRHPLFENDKNSYSFSREKWLDILQKYEYGYTPEGDCRVTATVILDKPKGGFARKAVWQQIMIDTEAPFGSFSFPINFLRPKHNKNAPVFVILAFSSDIPDEYLPAEELIDRGYAFVVVNYEDIVNDRLFGDYSDGIGKAYFNGRPREKEEWGKIGMWAYGASRIADYLMTRDDIDKQHLILAGHSRLGKTVLWAAAMDDRFCAVCANGSCMGGAQLTRPETDPEYNVLGEPIARFIRAGSWDWFCERYKDYVGRESERPFDQHMLLASIAPRMICLGCGVLDTMDDYKSVYLSAIAATEAYEKLGKSGLVHPNRYPEIGDMFGLGEIEYHLRDGSHFFSRTDWNFYMDYLDSKIK